MGKNRFDCIIVGLGLAGSALAVQFLLRKKKILVFDQPSENNSSTIAAGLFNPISGKRMIKTWLADELFPYLKKFYQQVENLTHSHFFYSSPIYRPFLSVVEQNEWMAGSSENSLSGFVKKVFTSSQHGEFIYDDLGGILLEQSGYLDTKTYISSVRSWLIKEGSYRDEFLDFNELNITASDVNYKDSCASRIICCDGVKSASGKLFSWLPLLSLKGETLCIKAKFLKDVIVNRGVYLVPNGMDQWRVGSTYQRDFNHGGITDEGREELVKNLESLVKIDYEIIGHDAGIRPVTPDRRPILGKHPEHPTVLIFNGMGTKGVSLAPYFSEMLIHSIDNSIRINKEVDINRYKSLYWNSR
ncbi:MAG TPA: FAD-dependent oxidoreductase [Cyclobacteriaceae bacterium]|nr:FAD-dependent oxidoreductase [Cyclobacteriaceae bacterium]